MFAKLKTRITISTFIAFSSLLLLFTETAKADSSCNVLLNSLGDLYLRGYTVSLQHLTDYQTFNNTFGGYTFTTLSARKIQPNPRYYYYRFNGSGSRLLFRSGSSSGSEPISYTIYNASLIGAVQYVITFNGQYGPYDVTCLGDKFMIVNTSDSIETFAFTTFRLNRSLKKPVQFPKKNMPSSR